MKTLFIAGAIAVLAAAVAVPTFAQTAPMPTPPPMATNPPMPQNPATLSPLGPQTP
jgi:hypothetical protein